MITHGGTLHGWLRIGGSGGLLFVAYTLCRVRGLDDDDDDVIAKRSRKKTPIGLHGLNFPPPVRVPTNFPKNVVKLRQPGKDNVWETMARHQTLKMFHS